MMMLYKGWKQAKKLRKIRLKEQSGYKAFILGDIDNYRLVFLVLHIHKSNMAEIPI